MHREGRERDSDVNVETLFAMEMGEMTATNFLKVKRHAGSSPSDSALCHVKKLLLLLLYLDNSVKKYLSS